MDLLLRLQAGNSNCDSVTGNSAVIRDDLSDLDEEELGYFANAGYALLVGLWC